MTRAHAFLPATTPHTALGDATALPPRTHLKLSFAFATSPALGAGKPFQ